MNLKLNWLFKIFLNFIRVTFKFNKDKFGEETEEISELTKTQKSSINLTLDSPTIKPEHYQNY